MTQVPYVEALLALATMEGGPEHPPDAVEPEEFVLCELGDHDESAEHAGHLWTADTTDDQDLWLLWSGTGAHRVHRLDLLHLCPAVLRELATRTVTTCAFFDHHPGPHSFSVTDPLGDLIAEHVHSEVRRLVSEGDGRGPGMPDAPGTPDAPGASDAPGRPDTPGMPDAPDAPGAPGAPGAPDAPGAPGWPGAPGAPGRPDAPGTLNGPGASGRPETPDVPDTDAP
ncbi:hypothetical protein [Streptomyces rubiginosohelvolus]|uniref:hypothetical protein n=1 Tax=Streptomyces rubiginosohelvolus TaxID=67362 RepID=UPI0035DDF5D8